MWTDYRLQVRGYQEKTGIWTGHRLRVRGYREKPVSGQMFVITEKHR
jgi:hypothetical protein